MLTREGLEALAPRGHREYLDALIDHKALLEAAGLFEHPANIACFLGQAGHETGGFTILRENTNWTAEQMCRLWPSRFKTTKDPRILMCGGDEVAKANLAYSKRADLGNVGGDDGWAYRGGSFLQATGRAMFAEVGNYLGIDLEGNPHWIEDMEIGLKAALYVWVKNDLNRFAQRFYYRAVGNAINRGSAYSRFEPIGAQSREKWTLAAWRMIGDGSPPASPILYLGAAGDVVAKAQAQLKSQGYPVGDCDGVLGPAMARAVASFKLDNKRNTGVDLAAEEPDEGLGPLTLGAIEVAPAIQHSLERSNATEADLVAKGSVEARAAQQAKAVGSVTTAATLAKVADDTGAVDWGVSQMAQVTAMKGTVVPFVEALQWGLRNFYLVLFIGLGIWFWKVGYKLIAARLEAHRTGKNMSR